MYDREHDGSLICEIGVVYKEYITLHLKPNLNYVLILFVYIYIYICVWNVLLMNMQQVRNTNIIIVKPGLRSDTVLKL